MAANRIVLGYLADARDAATRNIASCQRSLDDLRQQREACDRREASVRAELAENEAALVEANALLGPAATGELKTGMAPECAGACAAGVACDDHCAIAAGEHPRVKP